MSTPLDRRAFLERAALLGAAAMVGGTFVSACSKPAEFSCTDVTGLSEEDAAKRTELQYADSTPRQGMACNNCSFYTAAETGCGGCSILAGPIHPEGWCASWAAVA
jgi:hypothetical protein